MACLDLLCSGANESSMFTLFQRGYPTERVITHYYYPGWPDRGVPRDTLVLCGLADHVRQQIDAAPRLGPAVVHCRYDRQHSGPALSRPVTQFRFVV